MKINELNYDLELDKVVEKIRLEKANLVLLQFPEGLKDYALSVVDYLEERVKNVEFLIWFGSCFGACDTPQDLGKTNQKIDMTVQFGHNEKMPDY